MNNKRSYLDNINAGRRRRPSPDESLDHISRTLDQLENRLDRARSPRDPWEEENEVARRFQRLSDNIAEPYTRPVARPAPSSRASLERAARELERSRQQEFEVTSIGNIASELKTLRHDLREVMRSGLSGEFETLRRELAGIMAAVPNTALSSELVVEFERLSQAIAQLSERGDDRNVKMLRLEMEELKSSIGALAREETLQAVDRRWDMLDDRWNAFEGRISESLRSPDAAFDMLHQRLEDIGNAINSLPDSLSLHSLEERVRTLAGALDQLVSRKSAGNAELYASLDERLDEISRAIAASARRPEVASIDPQPFERIEARISTLANQVAEVLEDRAGGQAVDRLGNQMAELSRRVDDIAQRIDLPEQMVERLAGKIAELAERLDTTPQSQAAEMMLHGLEGRLAHLSQLIEQRQDDASELGRNLAHDLEQRLQEITARLDERASFVPDQSGIMASIDARFNELAAHLAHSINEPQSSTALRSLEMRLEDISSRLHESSASASTVAPEMIQNLEAQVKSLSEHLSRPSAEMPEFEDIGPRLQNIERSIHENRTAVLEAARQAAAQAVNALGNSASTGEVDERLRDELKALETLTRKSDERNTKTFEAIHDTLLKIVDRLGAVEGTARAGAVATSAAKIAVQEVPSIEPSEEAAVMLPVDKGPAPMPRSPAEAAAAAARAAMDEDGEIDEVEVEKPSLLGGLSRKLASRRAKPVSDAVVVEERAEPEVSAATETVEIDMDRINEPLEPGTGAPDLNAIMRRVRDEKKSPAREGNDAAKSDFIAAARRAAQAAAAEAEILKKRQEEKADTSGRFGLGKLLKRSRKPLVVALGAGIAVTGGYELSKAYLSESTAISSLASIEKPAALEPAELDQVATGSIAKLAPERQVRVVDDEPAEEAVVDTLATMHAQDAEAILEASTGKFEERFGEQNGVQKPLAFTPAQEMAAEKVAIETIAPDAGPVALREAAAGGDPKAFFEIANRYMDGQGGAVDPAKAIEWYTKAADAGFAPAQSRLGDIYQKGIGIDRDPAKAKMWFQLAAEQGNASAMHNLGVLFAMGATGETDNQSAARWFLEAAEHGVTDSQFNLGILAAKGMGTKQDLTEAYKWFDLVARSGDKDAAAKRDEVAANMSPELLKQGKDKALLWKPKPVDPAVNLVDIPDAWRTAPEATASVDMRKAITNIQLILNKEGFDAGTPDGLMGAKTKAAISAFQKASGMKPTGEVDEALVRALLERNKAATGT
ncbi:peptidoglycan binding domain-containing protein [Nitratireductor indicus C115]|uniref:Peptidoglycan binding domain-containing protein n=1 Tax=Nitratireductor indicus C115 TaxID=1231190 RepID=K2N9Y9_9HYPH|nr:peptidoglycan-binding protein [Nitratireductor indicus]EKF44438.1 peptidoglycan binding domain-containing protein [Nitratireductor indicus C115]SFQ29472.1 localization factor PodJL [Nitratireductor indicus]